VDQGGGVEGVAGGFGGHARGGELAHLVVHERQQVGRGPAVAGRGSIEETGHIRHHGRVYQRLAAETRENEGDRALSPRGSYPQPNDVSFLAARSINPDGVVISSGYRGQHTPGNHGEQEALVGIRDDVVKGAIVYSTLEPCTVAIQRDSPRNLSSAVWSLAGVVRRFAANELLACEDGFSLLVMTTRIGFLTPS
jgi:hypothetical protein